MAIIRVKKKYFEFHFNLIVIAKILILARQVKLIL